MHVHIVKVGNSKGVRLPKAVLEQCSFEDVAELEVQEGCIVLRPLTRKKREGWEKSFNSMHLQGDDRLLHEEVTTEWEDTEWHW